MDVKKTSRVLSDLHHIMKTKKCVLGMFLIIILNKECEIEPCIFNKPSKCCKTTLYSKRGLHFLKIVMAFIEMYLVQYSCNVVIMKTINFI